MTVNYEDLEDLISFENFSFSYYWRDEKEVLEPQLRQLGFDAFEWHHGEFDSFGPLTRVCFCLDKNGDKKRFIYG